VEFLKKNKETGWGGQGENKVSKKKVRWGKKLGRGQ
jgi:hypothetical protein